MNRLKFSLIGSDTQAKKELIVQWPSAIFCCQNFSFWRARQQNANRMPIVGFSTWWHTFNANYGVKIPFELTELCHCICTHRMLCVCSASTCNIHSQRSFGLAVGGTDGKAVVVFYVHFIMTSIARPFRFHRHLYLSASLAPFQSLG